MLSALSVTSLLRAAAVSLTVLAIAAPGPVLAQDAQQQAPQGLSESVAATVNDDIISTYDLVQRMRLLIVTTGVQPTQESLPGLQREALRSLIDERLQMQELHRVEKQQKLDLVATDQEVTDEITDIAKSNNTTAEALLGSLAERGVDPVTFRNQIRTNISWQRWIAGRYGSRLRVGDDQIKALLQRQADSATKPQYLVSEVVLDAARVGGMETAQTGAEQLVAQLQQGAPFAAVARQFSSAPDAGAGGDMGWIAANEVPTEVAQALEAMRPGQLSRPIPVKDGFYIVLLRDKHAGATSQLVNLKQVAVALPADAPPEAVEAARVTLEGVRPKLKGCEDLEAIAGKTDGVLVGDLGEAEVKDLTPSFREAVEGLQPGQISAPIRTAAGLHLVAVCAKRSSGSQGLSHDQMEARLYNMQLSQISKRYLRDLKNAATIEVR
ncbi:MAG: peptidylprolyl isomerase [Caulobacter sp.]|nr:peptidylprolyl isomerase [Caulobacter sp.]